jgi:two-component system, cell cycle sensor histidine kinase PleC
MTADEITIALEPFGQVDAGHNRRYEGTGLGLPMAQRLTELHGGSLHIKSEMGHGTTVSIHLPAYRIAGHRTEEQSQVSDTPARIVSGSIVG